MSDTERVPVPPEGADYDANRYATAKTEPIDASAGAFGAHSTSYDSVNYGSQRTDAYRAPDSAFQPGSGNMGNTAPQPSYTPPAANAAAGAPESPKKEKRGLGAAGAVLSGIVGAAVAVALVVGLWSFTPTFDSLKGTSGTSGTISIEQASEDNGASIAEAVAAKCIDSVVTIYVYTDTGSSWSQLFGGSSGSSDSPSALGSGVIIGNEGNEYYIITNYHVVENISKATVKVGDQEYSATPVGYDDKTDIAVIKIEASGLTVAEWGDSSSLKVGEWAGVIGTPHGYEQSLTVGVISALYRSETINGTDGPSVYTDMIQTDAAINPGNSGGGLFDAEGKLVGINTYIASTSGSSASIGFAIPQKNAQEIAEEIISGKKVEHAFLGISMGTSDEGVAVAAVYKDTAAADAGLKTGDIITKIDGKTVSKTSDVSETILAKKPGDKLTLTIKRDGEEQEVEATLKADDDVEEYAEGGEPETQDSGSGKGDGNGNDDNGGGFGWYGYNLEDLFGGNPFSYGYGDDSGSGSGSGNGDGSGNGSSNGGSSSNSGSFWN